MTVKLVVLYTTPADPAAFDSTARKLANLFAENYAQFQEGGTFKGTMDG